MNMRSTNTIYAAHGYKILFHDYTDSGILLVSSTFISQTALTNIVISIKLEHFYALVLSLVSCDTLSSILWYFRSHMNKTNDTLLRVRDMQYRHANALHAILIKAFFEAPGFSWTRIILGCALRPF